MSQKQQGAGLLEFSVSVAVVGILMGLLLQTMYFYQEKAEEVAIQQTVANIRASLEIRVAQRELQGQAMDLVAFAEQNPLNLLKDKPINYSGELFHPNDDDIGRGNWCYDRADKTLIYLLNNRNSLKDAQTKRLKFKVKLTRLPQNNAKPSGAPDEPVGVAFEQVKD